jgi:microcystin-dependent protein
MAEPFLSEIRLFSFDFPPKGWAFCNGQLLPINQNQALFALLGTTYGGNGQTNFALPNLQGRVPIHFGGGHTLGEKAGASSVTITQQQMPTHVHMAQGVNAAATTNTPSSSVQVATSGGANMWAAPSNLTAMAATAVPSVGGSQAHDNMMPYLVLNFCIALQGIFPSQN